MQYDSNSISWAARLLASTSHSFLNSVWKFVNAAGTGSRRNNLPQVEAHILQDTQDLQEKPSFKGDWSAGTENRMGSFRK